MGRKGRMGRKGKKGNSKFKIQNLPPFSRVTKKIPVKKGWIGRAERVERAERELKMENGKLTHLSALRAPLLT